MNKLIVGAVLAAGMGLAGVAAAGIASAAPTVDCSGGCVNRSTIAAEPAATAAEDPVIPLTGAPWTDFFSQNNLWERFTDPAGDGQGAWEKGVSAVNGGAWEKAFPPAP